MAARFAALVAALLCACAPPARDELTIVLAGDLGFGKSGREVGPRPWEELFAGVAGLLDGDLRFANLETVVSARPGLPRSRKRTRTWYRAHPAALRAARAAGFELFSLANNHAFDYRSRGLLDTVAELDRLDRKRPLAYAGAGADRAAAARPATVERGGARIALGALGIVAIGRDAGRASETAPGTMDFSSRADREQVLRELAAADADVRILSVHHGYEGDVRTDELQRRELRAARAAGVDLVVGHHAHVARGVELAAGRAIFYGLGNFLLLDGDRATDDPRRRVAADFGLLARVHLSRERTGRYAVRAIEAIPLDGTREAPRPFPPDEARLRIEVLNVLAESLDEPTAGAAGVRFGVRPDGTGLYCASGAGGDPGRAGDLCRSAPAPVAPSALARERVAGSPGPDEWTLRMAKRRAADGGG